MTASNGGRSATPQELPTRVGGKRNSQGSWVATHSGRESRRGFTASPSRCGDGNHLRSQPGFPRPEFLPPLALTATLARSCCRTKCEDERSVWIRRNRRRLQTFGTWFAPSPESLDPVMISNCLFVDALHSSGCAPLPVSSRLELSGSVMDVGRSAVDSLTNSTRRLEHVPLA